LLHRREAGATLGLEPDEMINAIISWLIGTAVLAFPVCVAAKLVKANLNSYGWAFIATFLNLVVQTAIAFLIPTPLIGLPLAIISSILLYSLALGTTLPKAALVIVIQAAIFALIAVVVIYGLGGSAYVELYGHRVTFSR